jgi:hypothetical protein
VTLALDASDSIIGHTLSYAWSATCGGGLAAGLFSDPTAKNPTWTAPANATGTQQTCALSVAITDGHDQSANGAWSAHVESVPDVVTITAGPTGTPEPVASNGAVTLSTSATDSIIGHSVSYLWSATCTGSLAGGSFAPSASVQSPTWTAPINLTGAQQTCTLSIVASDGGSQSASATWTHRVDAVPDVVTITAGPAATPSPVASSGTVALTLSANDPYSHPLTYAWSASCPGLGASSFTPSASAQNPTWNAPKNRTGSQQACTLSLVIDDGLGHSTNASVVVPVNSVPDMITITEGPTATPDPIASAGTVVLTVTATDSIIGHTLSYAWSATCPALSSNGAFLPNATTQSATWTAPVNATGSQQACDLVVVVTDGHGQTAQGTWTHQVDSVADAVTITAGPTASPSVVPSSGNVTLNVSASDSIIGHALTYAWSATCLSMTGTGNFSPNESAQNPTWTAPVNKTGAQQACTISVVVSDGHGQSANGSVTQQVQSLPDVITVLSTTANPNPTASGDSVNLAVVAADSLDHTLTYSWQATCPAQLSGHGSFANASSAATTWTAPENRTSGSQTCVLQLTIVDGHGHTQYAGVDQVVSRLPNTIRILSGPTATPNPVESGGAVAVFVTADTTWAPLTYSWRASCPWAPDNGTFDNPAIASTTWMAPVNSSATDNACTIEVTVGDGGDSPQIASFYQTVKKALNCTYDVHPILTSLAAEGGAGSVNVEPSDPKCTWTAAAGDSWVSISGGANGTGSGVVTFALTASRDPEPRTGMLTVAGQSVPVTQSGTGYRYYFAEGATIGGFFGTEFALLNLDATQAATVAVDFQLKDTTTVLTYDLVIGAHARATLDVATLGATNPGLAPLASAEFSTVIRADRPLVADRTMTWDTTGYGSHAEASIPAPASEWFLAEGATLGDFELYYLIQNPNPEPLTNEIEVTYLLPPPAAPLVRTYSMGANTRTNIVVHAEPGLENVELSAIIRTPASKPVIVERAMYLTAGGLFYGAGHESAGIRAPQTQWFFAEGATGPFFDLFILVGNPQPTDAHITATFLFDDGTTCSLPATVGAQSRYNIWVDVTVIDGCPRSLADAAVSTTITADRPVVAERTMWWPGVSWAEAHNAAGATTTGIQWALAGGEQGGPRGRETYILIANASASAGTARVTLYFEDGTSLQKDVALMPNSRANVAVGADFGPAVLGKRFGAVIESLPVAGQPGPAQIVVERAMYANGPGAAFWAAGTDLLATRIR